MNKAVVGPFPAKIRSGNGVQKQAKKSDSDPRLQASLACRPAKARSSRICPAIGQGTRATEFRLTLPAAWHQGRDAPQLPLRMGGTSPDSGLPGTVRAGGIRP